ncbi:MAG TPA: hypothetical protein VNS32_13885 [Flavisolibacter sp.]|nr:hypothetical protein [Flavisolibacter sp.]
MARVFTTRFAFNHQTYDAIVTVISQDGQLKFAVRLMDSALLELLPDGHFNYTGKDGFKDIPTDNHQVHTLIQSIAVSVEKHLTVQP